MFRVERVGGFSFKVCRDGGGSLPEQLRGMFSSESSAKLSIRSHIELIEARRDVIKERSLAKSSRVAARKRKRAADVES